MRYFFIIILLTTTKTLALEKYILECRNDLLELSEMYAISQIGTLEKTGRNDGEVFKYQKLLGLKEGSPYCAAGIYWCYYQASNELRLGIRDIPILKSAVANLIYNDAKRCGIIAEYIPEKHDLIVWRKPRSWSGHIERVLEVRKAGWVITIGFNTKDRSGNEGVFRKKRNVFHPLGRLAIRGLIGFKERIN
jgi:hypothetical protein